MSAFKVQLEHNANLVSGAMAEFLQSGAAPEHRLIDAMRYSALNGGKRIRPFLVLECASLFSVDEKSSIRVAAAIEMIHCYSLIHDDLPAMDDDDLRRGKATCHIAFDEATAILAGDALLTKSFEVVADANTHGDPAVRADLVLAFAKAAGASGMVGGQMLDLVAADHALDMPEITRLQRMKTGELIAVSCMSGGILGKASKSARLALQAYAHDIGLAFQIADDLLDVEGSAELVGKAVGKDEAAGKATFVSLLGVEHARSQARLLVDQAIEHLVIFEKKADNLRSLARFIIERDT